MQTAALLLSAWTAWVTSRPVLDEIMRARAQSAALGESAAPMPVLPIVRRVHASDQVVVLTFDACATRNQANGFDTRIFDILRREQVPATIFVSGRWVETHPEAMQALAADPLIEFGNHTYDHPHMTWLDDAHLTAEITRTSALIGRYGKHDVAFRPPFGDIDGHVIGVVAHAGLPTVTWDVVSGDPARSATTDSIVNQVMGHARAGSIIIFHINGRAPHTADALSVILPALRAKGYAFASLSSFLRHRTADGAP